MLQSCDFVTRCSMIMLGTQILKQEKFDEYKVYTNYIFNYHLQKVQIEHKKFK